MNARKNLSIFAFGLVLMVSASTIVDAKEWTINARQDQLMKEINESQKKADLTAKEAKRLRSKLADIARREAKVRSKSSTATISDEERVGFEKELNEVSVEIKKLALDKRVDAAQSKADAKQTKSDEKKSGK